ncbi:hypothetical protein ACTXT7_014390 [Hymenolepis weldensis]
MRSKIFLDLEATVVRRRNGDCRKIPLDISYSNLTSSRCSETISIRKSNRIFSVHSIEYTKSALGALKPSFESVLCVAKEATEQL